MLWPGRLHAALTARMERKVQKLLAETKGLETSSVRYREIWYWLRGFPMNGKGDPTATRPTLIGNILEGYESYPNRRYNMNSIFYWYRLWPTLPQDFKNQADLASARADTLMFGSTSALLSGVLFASLAGIRILHERLPSIEFIAFVDALPSSTALFALGIFYVLLFYLFYRMSIPLHRTDGEFYKAAFDLYRNNIKGITEISEEERSNWYKTWSYLQYMYVQCKICKKYFYAEEDKCPYCKSSRSQQQVTGS